MLGGDAGALRGSPPASAGAAPSSRVMDVLLFEGLDLAHGRALDPVLAGCPILDVLRRRRRLFVRQPVAPRSILAPGGGPELARIYLAAMTAGEVFPASGPAINPA